MFWRSFTILLSLWTSCTYASGLLERCAQGLINLRERALLHDQTLEYFLEALNVAGESPQNIIKENLAVSSIDPKLFHWIDPEAQMPQLIYFKIKEKWKPAGILYLSEGENTFFMPLADELLYSSWGNSQGRMARRIKIETDLKEYLPALFQRSIRSDILPSPGERNLHRGIELHREDFSPVFRNSLSHDELHLTKFPSVFEMPSMFLFHLMGEVAQEGLNKNSRVLVLGSGGGIEAAVIAKTFGVSVDAVDINPFAVANTKATAKLFGVEDQVRVWTSDVFDQVPLKYDLILFNAPYLAPADEAVDSQNYRDPGGRVLFSVLNQLPEHLRPGGKLLIMTVPDLQGNLPPNLVATQRQEFMGSFSIQDVQVKTEPSLP